MTKPRAIERRDPVATRAHIVSTALRLLAEEGESGLSVSRIAREAGVNRGTAYMHFGSRDELVSATMNAAAREVSDALQANRERNYPPDSIAFVERLERFSLFLMNNSRLARIWLADILTTGRRHHDPLASDWDEAVHGFAKTDRAEPGIDADVLSALVLGGLFLFPLWIDAETLTAEQRRNYARRYAREVMRNALHGLLKPGSVPGFEAVLAQRMAEDLDPAPAGG